MKKIKIGKWEVSREEVDREIKQATRRGQEQLKTERQAKRIYFDRNKNKLVIDLKDGATVLLPLNIIQGLADASPRQIEKGKLGPRGAYLHWDNLGVDFTLAGLLNGIYGTKAWMAKIQGKSKSKVRVPSFRVNERKAEGPRIAASPRKRVSRKIVKRSTTK
jgi:Protein of unknown function (DUF2442)